jgi:DNA-binding CsgD family transcriptional regulator
MMGRSIALRLTSILASRSGEDLEQAALGAARKFGFRYFLFCGSFSPRPAREVRFGNFPAGWHRHCADRGKDLLPGPLRRLALEEVTPLLWSGLTPQHPRAFAHAKRHGLATGVSCPVRGPRGQWSLATFALPRSGPSAERRILSVLPECQLVACAIHYASARLTRRVLDRALPLRRLGRAANGLLSERESQCLIQSARGKTTSEIAAALQISERTVAFHLSNVRRKLDAANSRHAVTKALSLKLIAAGP